jgi:pseudouridine kinase
MIMQRTAGYVVGVGAANVDVHGQSKKALVMRDSNPGHLHTSVGGVTRNIIENAARLGLDARMISVVGDDVYGDMILENSVQAGIDMQHCLRIPGAVSSSYVSILDDRGDMFVAVSDMSVLGNLSPAFLDSKRQLLHDAAVIVCDPCMPPDMLRYLIHLVAGQTPLFIDPVSTAYAAVAKEYIGGFHTVKPNKMELEILSGMQIEDDGSLRRACSILIEKGVRRVFATFGEQGAYYQDSDERNCKMALRPVEKMVNATGAGAAITAGLVYSYLAGLDIEQTLAYALAAGIVGVQGSETINPEMSIEALDKTIRERKV